MLSRTTRTSLPIAKLGHFTAHIYRLHTIDHGGVNLRVPH
jgi:hypothetical protein